MKADTLSLKQLFQKDIRYLIPEFQRPYVWTQDKQLDPLWQDVQNTAARLLDEWPEGHDVLPAKVEEGTPPHFLGAIVLKQQSTRAADLETRDVIDGQQRLTTMQLLLDAAQEVFEREKIQPQARRLKKLVLNDKDLVEEAKDKFKILPTQLDQEAFWAAMDNYRANDQWRESKIVQAHEFFQLQISQWLKGSPGPSRLAAALETTLLRLLQLVVIDLDVADDSHLIFETLNARGTPLLESELVKNYALHRARDAGLDGKEMYDSYWKSFETTWWRETIRQGRVVRPRTDAFLNHWLVMKTLEPVTSSKVFRAFKEHARRLEIADLTREIDVHGKVWQQLIGDGFPEGNRSGPGLRP